MKYLCCAHCIIKNISDLRKILCIINCIPNSFFRFGSKLNEVCPEDMHRAFQNEDVDNVLSMFDLMKSLPPTSVMNETSFSAMKLTKRERRTQLTY